MDDSTQATSTAANQDSGNSADQGSPSATDSKATSAAQTFFKRVVEGAHDTVDDAAAKVAPVFDGLSKAGDTKDEWIGSARDAIREHPFAAVATALLLGAAYVSLTRSSRD